jgi:trimethylamine--corrinoid protein Co-methyltransferase
MDTAKKCRTHSWNPLVGVRGNTGGGSPSEKYLDSIADRQRAMLDGYSPPPMDRGLLAELDDCMLRQGVDRRRLSTICSQVWGRSTPCNTHNGRTS